jgi:YfiH family protein
MHIIYPEWSAPSFVKACTFAHDQHIDLHAKKNPVRFNALLQKELNLPNIPVILEQVHSNICVHTDESSLRTCDASITQLPRKPLAILTADCLPLLICHQNNQEIANIHAGWRGLYGGIIENTFQLLKDEPSQYQVWIGPAICENCYEVGEEFKNNFLQKYPTLEQEFKKYTDWHFNLAHAAESVLKMIGVKNITQSNICTFENNRLFSYRREQDNASRLATLIWLEE